MKFYCNFFNCGRSVRRWCSSNLGAAAFLRLLISRCPDSEPRVPTLFWPRCPLDSVVVRCRSAGSSVDWKMLPWPYEYQIISVGVGGLVLPASGWPAVTGLAYHLPVSQPLSTSPCLNLDLVGSLLLSNLLSLSVAFYRFLSLDVQHIDGTSRYSSRSHPDRPAFCPCASRCRSQAFHPRGALDLPRSLLCIYILLRPLSDRHVT